MEFESNFDEVSFDEASLLSESDHTPSAFGEEYGIPSKYNMSKAPWELKKSKTLEALENYGKSYKGSCNNSEFANKRLGDVVFHPGLFRMGVSRKFPQLLALADDNPETLLALIQSGYHRVRQKAVPVMNAQSFYKTFDNLSKGDQTRLIARLLRDKVGSELSKHAVETGRFDLKQEMEFHRKTRKQLKQQLKAILPDSFYDAHREPISFEVCEKIYNLLRPESRDYYSLEHRYGWFFSYVYWFNVLKDEAEHLALFEKAGMTDVLEERSKLYPMVVFQNYLKQYSEGFTLSNEASISSADAAKSNSWLAIATAFNDLKNAIVLSHRLHGQPIGFPWIDYCPVADEVCKAYVRTGYYYTIKNSIFLNNNNFVGKDRAESLAVIQDSVDADLSTLHSLYTTLENPVYQIANLEEPSFRCVLYYQGYYLVSPVVTTSKVLPNRLSTEQLIKKCEAKEDFKNSRVFNDMQLFTETSLRGAARKLASAIAAESVSEPTTQLKPGDTSGVQTPSKVWKVSYLELVTEKTVTVVADTENEATFKFLKENPSIPFGAIISIKEV